MATRGETLERRLAWALIVALAVMLWFTITKRVDEGLSTDAAHALWLRDHETRITKLEENR